MRIERIGVVGAGTMGAGIAQVACLGGIETRLHDPVPEALEAGVERVHGALEKGAARGRWREDDAKRASPLLRSASRLEDLAGCGLVIEAAPEDPTLKQKLFGQLAEICGPETVLATNTSSLSVAAIAAAVPEPGRVVGMHFFNPPALMKLVEVVAGPESSEDALRTVAEVAERMGRTAVHAADEIGFIANRCARPYSLEALRLLGDRVADVETIDRICRIGGGFRMGPFELTDLVGIDVNLEVAKSFWERSFHEPRWQPHPIQQQMVSAGRLGRKSGRGYYDYSIDPYRPRDPEPAPSPNRPEDRLKGRDEGAGASYLPSSEGQRTARPVEVVGEGELAEELRVRLARRMREKSVPRPAPQPGDDVMLVLLATGSLAELDEGGGAIGFHLLGPLDEATLVELTAGKHATQEAREAAEQRFRSLGLRVEWVGDCPGLLLGRIVCQLVNEAAFALQKGIGSAEDIDAAMRLGYNYPRGPLEWGDSIGLDHVLAVLDALREELGEERYRAAPLLRRLVADGQLGRSTGRGFFAHR